MSGISPNMITLNNSKYNLKTSYFDPNFYYMCSLRNNFKLQINFVQMNVFELRNGSFTEALLVNLLCSKILLRKEA